MCVYGALCQEVMHRLLLPCTKIYCHLLCWPPEHEMIFSATEYNRRISENSNYQPAALLRMTSHKEDSVEKPAKTRNQPRGEDNHDGTNRKTQPCGKSREQKRNDNDLKRFHPAQTHVASHNRRLLDAVGTRIKKSSWRNIRFATTPQMKNECGESIKCIKKERAAQTQCSDKDRNSSNNTGKDGDVMQLKIRQSTTVALGSIPFSNYSEAKNICKRKSCELSGEDVACDGCGGTPCYWTQYGRDVQLHVNMEHGDREQDVEGQKVRRFSAYRRFCLERHGFLGIGFRVQLPVCVTRAIRAIWPDPSGHYVGFKDSTGLSDRSGE